ncbi:MAG: metallophosphoesterase [Alsobacter sp.]
MRLTRRGLFGASAAGGLLAAGTFTASAETMDRARVTRHDLALPHWPAELALTLAVIADLHACEPWMNEERVTGIVEQTNALGADAVVLLGDYVVGHGLGMTRIPEQAWARPLGRLSARLGVHAVLGNHDWWADEAVQRSRSGLPQAARALEEAGIPVLHNRAVRLSVAGARLWLAGLGDQEAFNRSSEPAERFGGVDDLPGTLAQVPENASVILLAHEPDVFPHVPDRVSLTLSGHTHGGQVKAFGYAPLIPSRYGSRYLHGHVEEDGRHLVVSGGLGCSVLPLRWGCPPEILLLSLSGTESPAA